MASGNSSSRGAHQSIQEQIIRHRKRQQPPVFNGVNNSYEDRNSDFLCPICFDTIEEAYMTKCGHTFCFKCISLSLEQSNRCPKCNFIIEKKDQIFPNFLLNELITKYKQKFSEKRLKLDNVSSQSTSEIQEFLTQNYEHLDLASVHHLLKTLERKKQQLEADTKGIQIQLLKEFLQQTRKHKLEQEEQLQKEVGYVDEDMRFVEESLQNHKSATHGVLTLSMFENLDSSGDLCASVEQPSSSSGNAGGTTGQAGTRTVVAQEGFNGSKYTGPNQWFSTSMASRRRRMHMHFDDLETCYFSVRAKEFEATTRGNTSQSGLEEFTENLAKFTQFSTVRPLATLNYASDLFNGSSIVSSIEFDKDNEYFAIAGVTKKIKVFEYGTVIKDTVDMHYPVNEMVCNSKISCISWSSYHKGMLASSDYEGSVSVWDAFTGQKVRLFQEHEKRCWSVDFNKVDTKLIASGSDDSRVKLWSTQSEHSITCLEAKANVCCVKFNPESRFHLAFGSADHFVHYYDLRNTKQALGVFRGHKKAVSYVKFLSSEELVSASTDSQLKLWSINKPHCLRSFKGHLNEKNFVGLATDSDYIACGSENNALYVYYKGLTKQVLTFRFDTVRSVLEKDKKDDDLNEFVSAVCWRGGSNVVVAANSQGTIKVLELV